MACETSLTSSRLQFSLGAVFWSTASVGLVLSYLRSFGTQPLLFGLATIPLAAASGLLFGYRFGRTRDAVFWSLIGGMFAVLCAASSSLGDHVRIQLTWVTVGCVVGAVAGIVPRGWTKRCMLSGGVTGGVAFSAMSAVVNPWPLNIAWETTCATVAGILFGFLIDVCYVAERYLRIGRHVIAALLMIVSILTSMLGARFVPSW